MEMAQVARGSIVQKFFRSKLHSDLAGILLATVVFAAGWLAFRPLVASDAAVTEHADAIAVQSAALNAPPNVIVQAELGEICSANEKGEISFTQDVCLKPGRHYYVVLPRADCAAFRLDNTIASVNIIDRRGGDPIAKNGGEDITNLMERDRTLKFYPVDSAGRRARNIPPFFMTVAYTSSIDQPVTWSAPLTPAEWQERW